MTYEHGGEEINNGDGRAHHPRRRWTSFVSLVEYIIVIIIIIPLKTSWSI
jgi:hypothetical protein